MNLQVDPKPYTLVEPSIDPFKGPLKGTLLLTKDFRGLGVWAEETADPTADAGAHGVAPGFFLPDPPWVFFRVVYHSRF